VCGERERERERIDEQKIENSNFDKNILCLNRYFLIPTYL
jgi:hypothetical protein